MAAGASLAFCVPAVATATPQYTIFLAASDGVPTNERAVLAWKRPSGRNSRERQAEYLSVPCNMDPLFRRCVSLQALGEYIWGLSDSGILRVFQVSPAKGDGVSIRVVSTISKSRFSLFKCTPLALMVVVPNAGKRRVRGTGSAEGSGQSNVQRYPVIHLWTASMLGHSTFSALLDSLAQPFAEEDSGDSTHKDGLEKLILAEWKNSRVTHNSLRCRNVHAIDCSTEGHFVAVCDDEQETRVMWWRMSSLSPTPKGLKPKIEGLSFSSPIISCAMGRNHTLLLQDQGKVLGTGSNSKGQLGTAHHLGPGTNLLDDAAPVGGLSGHLFSCVCAIGNCSLGLTVDGLVFSWGSNECNFLGNGSTSPSDFQPQPIQILPLGKHHVSSPKIQSLVVTPTQCIAMTDKSLFLWGDAPHTTPIEVPTTPGGGRRSSLPGRGDLVHHADASGPRKATSTPRHARISLSTAPSNPSSDFPTPILEKQPAASDGRIAGNNAGSSSSTEMLVSSGFRGRRRSVDLLMRGPSMSSLSGLSSASSSTTASTSRLHTAPESPRGDSGANSSPMSWDYPPSPVPSVQYPVNQSHARTAWYAGVEAPQGQPKIGSPDDDPTPAVAPSSTLTSFWERVMPQSAEGDRHPHRPARGKSRTKQKRFLSQDPPLSPESRSSSVSSPMSMSPVSFSSTGSPTPTPVPIRQDEDVIPRAPGGPGGKSRRLETARPGDGLAHVLRAQSLEEWEDVPRTPSGMPPFLAPSAKKRAMGSGGSSGGSQRRSKRYSHSREKKMDTDGDSQPRLPSGKILSEPLTRRVLDAQTLEEPFPHGNEDSVGTVGGVGHSASPVEDSVFRDPLGTPSSMERGRLVESLLSSSPALLEQGEESPGRERHRRQSGVKDDYHEGKSSKKARRPWTEGAGSTAGTGSAVRSSTAPMLVTGRRRSEGTLPLHQDSRPTVSCTGTTSPTSKFLSPAMLELRMELAKQPQLLTPLSGPESPTTVSPRAPKSARTAREAAKHVRGRGRGNKTSPPVPEKASWLEIRATSQAGAIKGGGDALSSKSAPGTPRYLALTSTHNALLSPRYSLMTGAGKSAELEPPSLEELARSFNEISKSMDLPELDVDSFRQTLSSSSFDAENAPKDLLPPEALPPKDLLSSLDSPGAPSTSIGSPCRGSTAGIHDYVHHVHEAVEARKRQLRFEGSGKSADKSVASKPASVPPLPLGKLLESRAPNSMTSNTNVLDEEFEHELGSSTALSQNYREQLKHLEKLYRFKDDRLKRANATIRDTQASVNSWRNLSVMLHKTLQSVVSKEVGASTATTLLSLLSESAQSMTAMEIEKDAEINRLRAQINHLRRVIRKSYLQIDTPPDLSTPDPAHSNSARSAGKPAPATRRASTGGPLPSAHMESLSHHNLAPPSSASLASNSSPQRSPRPSPRPLWR